MPGDNRLKIIVTIVAVSIIAVFSMDPIAQDPGYHHFADRRGTINIPNFYNVLSSLPFVIILKTAVEQKHKICKACIF